MFGLTLSGSASQNECWSRDRKHIASATRKSTLAGPHSFIAITWILVVGCLAAAPAQAGFMGDYNYTNFTQTVKTYDPINGVIFNSDSNAGATYNSTSDIVTLTGGNDGSGNPGEVDLFLTVMHSGSISFQYSYSTLDSPVCGPNSTDSCDPAGYLLGGVFTPLAGLTGDSGNVTNLAVSKGQVFGFRVKTLDNQNEPGIFSIGSFSSQLSSGSGSGPEPGTLSLMVLAGLAAAGMRRASKVRRDLGGKA